MVPQTGQLSTAAAGALIVVAASAFWWRRRQQQSAADKASSLHHRLEGRSHAAVDDLLLPFLQPSEDAAQEAARVEAEEAELLAEQLSRNIAYLGAGQDQVAASYVAILGVGGAGSHVAQLLGRTGVRRLRLIDCGRVSERSLGSHAVATAADAGSFKAEVIRRQLGLVLPAIEVEVVTERLEPPNAARVMFGAAAADGARPSATADAAGATRVPDMARMPDMVVACLPADAGDAIGGLSAALSECHARGVRCVAVLYASAEADFPPSEVAHQRFSSLHDVCGSVIARRLASHVRPRLPTSPPPPMAAAATLVVHTGEAACLRTHRPGAPTVAEVRAARSGGGIGSSGGFSLRGARLAGMGHAAASAVLCELGGCRLTPSSGLYTKANREDAHRALLRRERETFCEPAPPDVWPEDVEFLVTEVWGGVCVLTGGCIGGGGPALTLTRWDRNRRAAVDNLVLLTKDRAERHDTAEQPFAELGEELVAAVGRALEMAGRERRSWAVVAGASHA